MRYVGGNIPSVRGSGQRWSRENLRSRSADKSPDSPQSVRYLGTSACSPIARWEDIWAHAGVTSFGPSRIRPRLSRMCETSVGNRPYEILLSSCQFRHARLCYGLYSAHIPTLPRAYHDASSPYINRSIGFPAPNTRFPLPSHYFSTQMFSRFAPYVCVLFYLVARGG